MSTDPQVLPAVREAQPPPADAMLAVVERAARDPSIDVEKMERLLVMAERIHERKAEAEYDAAMNAAQAEMRPVANDADNPQTRSRYASYGAIDRAVRPVYTAHGFSLSFGTKSPSPDRVTVTCRISHRAGHTERVEIEMPSDGKGAKGGDVMTKTHATGSAVSYGMRYLLKMIFNVAIGEYDDDGNAASPRALGRARAPETRPEPKNAVAGQGARSAGHSGASSQPSKPAQDDKWRTLLAQCKAKLTEQIDPEFYWAWWRYAVDQGWILPARESVADAKPEAIFRGYDQANWRESLKAIAEDHRVAVTILAGSCSPELRNEILRAAVPLEPPQPGKIPGVPGTVRPATAAQPLCMCPKCRSTAAGASEDHEGVSVCDKCGWQWEAGGRYWEEYDWMTVLCPIPTKGTSLKDYVPITMGQIARTDSKRWYGMVMNTTVSEVRKGRDWNGKHYDPRPADLTWAQACEAAKRHLDQEKAAKGRGEEGNEDNEEEWDPGLTP